MNLTPNEQLKQSSNNINNDPTPQNPEEVTKDIKKTKRRKTPKTHNQQFNMQSIIHSVAGIGSGSANDFSFANIKTDFKTDSKTNIEKSIEKSIEKKAEEKTEKKVIAKKASSSTIKNTSNNTIKRSKKINKAKLQKVFSTNAFKKSNGTIKILPGLSKLVKQVSDRSAREIVTELLIKWLIKESPQSEAALLHLLDQHLDAG